MMYKLLIISSYFCSGGSAITQSVVEFETEEARQFALNNISNFPDGRYLSIVAIKL